mmetsp:Transcript_30460/g.61360  ORF Transcript_30460/g.61360 Transcript_30460/m.61360 type:complete len:357 (-) Transcript_30460:156-1226(-)
MSGSSHTGAAAFASALGVRRGVAASLCLSAAAGELSACSLSSEAFSESLSCPYPPTFTARVSSFSFSSRCFDSATCCASRSRRSFSERSLRAISSASCSSLSSMLSRFFSSSRCLSFSVASRALAACKSFSALSSAFCFASSSPARENAVCAAAMAASARSTLPSSMQRRASSSRFWPSSPYVCVSSIFLICSATFLTVSTLSIARACWKLDIAAWHASLAASTSWASTFASAFFSIRSPSSRATCRSAALSMLARSSSSCPIPLESAFFSASSASPASFRASSTFPSSADCDACSINCRAFASSLFFAFASISARSRSCAASRRLLAFSFSSSRRCISRICCCNTVACVLSAAAI